MSAELTLPFHIVFLLSPLVGPFFFLPCLWQHFCFTSMTYKVYACILSTVQVYSHCSGWHDSFDVKLGLVLKPVKSWGKIKTVVASLAHWCVFVSSDFFLHVVSHWSFHISTFYRVPTFVSLLDHLTLWCQHHYCRCHSITCWWSWERSAL